MSKTATMVRPEALAAKRRKLTMGYDLASRYLLVRGGYHSFSRRIYLEFAAKLLRYQFLSHYFGDPPNWRLKLRRLSKNRTLPDFCVIGGIKSGTSDLAVNLLLHPNVMTPFSKEFEDSEPENWREFYPTEKEKQHHMHKYGSALSPYLSPFLHRTDIMSNLSRVRPNTKVVLVLRDPAKRFYSHWKWEVLFAGRRRLGSKPFLATFPAFVEEALNAFGSRPMFTACGFDPIQTSLYPEAVAGWIAAFGRENVLVIDAGSYYDDRDTCLARIYDFVGLPAFRNPLVTAPVLENPLVLPAADDASMERLSTFFRPHNDQLWELIGERFDWC